MKEKNINLKNYSGHIYVLNTISLYNFQLEYTLHRLVHKHLDRDYCLYLYYSAIVFPSLSPEITEMSKISLYLVIWLFLLIDDFLSLIRNLNLSYQIYKIF